MNSGPSLQGIWQLLNHGGAKAGTFTIGTLPCENPGPCKWAPYFFFKKKNLKKMHLDKMLENSKIY